MTVLSQSRAAQVAYQDLLRLHLDETVSGLIGSVEERVRNGRVYLYDKFRIGTQMKSRYLGEGTPELQERLARAADLKAQAADRAGTRDHAVAPFRDFGVLPRPLPGLGSFGWAAPLWEPPPMAFTRGNLACAWGLKTWRRPATSTLPVFSGCRWRLATRFGKTPATSSRR